MKKIIFTLISLLLLLTVFTAAVSATDTPDILYLVDGAELLSDDEAEELNSTLEGLSHEHDISVVIVTTHSLEGKTPEAYADDYFDYNGYGEDGVLLLVSMEYSDWHISTTGYGITVFTDAGIEYMGDQFVPLLSEEEFYDAFCTFADLCDSFIVQANSGDPYDSHNLEEPLTVFDYLVFSVVAGFIAALITTGVMKRKLKSVRANDSASNYVDNNSLDITHSNEIYLYSHVTRVEKPKDSGGSSTHSSSSGRSHGGGGGKF